MRQYFGILIDDNNTAYIKEYPGCFREEAFAKCMCVGIDLDSMMSVADALNANMSGNKTYVEEFDYSEENFYKCKTADQLGDSVSHPAYGMIGFTRRTGSRGEALFGSSIEHRDTIAVTIRKGSVTRGLNTDWYGNEGDIIEAEMSYSQFADAITSFNIGFGVPCTIRRQVGVGILPPPNFVNKRDQYTNELKDSLDSNSKDAKEIYDRIATMFSTKSSIGKGDREAILRDISLLVNSFDANAEFAFKQFQQQMDKTIHEAKCEVEAFTQNKFLTITQQALVEHKDDLSKLESPVDISCLETNKTNK